MRCLRHLRFLPFLAVLLTATTGLIADDSRWVSLGSEAVPAPARVRVVALTSETLAAEIQLPGLLVQRDILFGEAFAHLRIDGGELLVHTGLPLLPVIRREIEVPRGARISLRLIPEDAHKISLAALGLPNRVLPSQPPRVKLPGADEGRHLELDERLYSRQALWPEETVAVAGRSIVRGHDLLLVELRPVRIRPAQGVIELWSRARLIIETVGGEACPPRRGSPAADPRTLGPRVLGRNRPAPTTCGNTYPASRNPTSQSAGTDAGSGSADGAEGMLVFVADDFVNALDPFIDWKRKTGFKVELVRMSELGASPTDSDI